jgi:hypothetical protein
MFALGNRTTVLLAAAFALTFNTFNAFAASKGKLPTPADFGESLIEVTATDTAGNTSAPATVTVFF